MNRLNQFTVFVAWSFVCILSLPVFGQQDPQTSAASDWRIQRKQIEATFRSELGPIAQWCRENGLDEQGETTMACFRNIDLNRQYIFLPNERMGTANGASADGLISQWQSKLQAAKQAQAQRVFALARKASSSGAGAFAFQCIHETLYYDPDFAEARRVLSHKKREDRWQIAAGRMRSKRATKANSTMNWPAKSYIIVTSDHFEIVSRASEEQTLFLAESLEKWHLVWRQVFFEFWNRASTLERWLDGKGQQRKSTKKFRIVFFESREQYVGELESQVPGIQVSSGYYNDSNKTSFFYYSQDTAIIDTWRHEATHQWFSESIRTNRSPFEDNHIWLCEGIAMYFESLTDFGDYVTLGGLESRRLQYSRVRRLRDNFYIPMQDLAAIGRTGLQQRQDIRRLYSQAAGLTHMLMNVDGGKYQPSLIEFLKLLYAGKLKSDTFEKVIGKTYQQLDQQYNGYLVPSSEEVAQYLLKPQARKELAFPKIALDVDAYRAIGNCSELEWLELTGNRLSAAQLKQLVGCRNLKQLYLSECPIEPKAFAELANLESLVELDLSGSSVQNADLAALAGCKSLRDLRLIATRITDEGLSQLVQIPNLKSVNLKQTGVSSAGIAQLKKLRPQLEIIK